MNTEKYDLYPFNVEQFRTTNVSNDSEIVVGKPPQNTDVAQAAANWANMGLEIELLANGAPIQDFRSPKDRKDPIATYRAIIEHPKKLSIGIRTGPKTGLVALTAYTNEPGVGLHALEEHGFFCPRCDTFFRYELTSQGKSKGHFHTVLFYSGKDCFLETVLDDFPEVVVRASGELISLPPEEFKLDPDIGVSARSFYECQDTITPVGITVLPDGLRELIRAAERRKMTAAKDFSIRPSVKAELYTPVTEGGRNNALTKRAGYLIGQKQLNETDTFQALLDINQRCCIPPLGACEVRNVVRSIFKRHHRHEN